MKKLTTIITSIALIGIIILSFFKFGIYSLIITITASFLTLILYDILRSYGLSFKIFQDKDKDTKILDITILTDSRCPDIITTGFLGYKFIIPKFLIEKLQKETTSPDEKKRNESRKALDIISRLRENEKLKIEIKNPKKLYQDYQDSLIELAKETKSQIITSDYEITKKGLINNLIVLNLNELYLSLKQAFLPGDEINVFILKEGKDKNQGVAYLDDGTMIVVENGCNYIGKKVDVIVQSILKNSTGKIIFTKIKW